MREFASKELAGDILPDRDGNLHLVLPGGVDVRNMCGKCGVQESEAFKLQVCARCKKIKYCSKECQTGDWKRHKREECAAKVAQLKTQMMGLHVPDRDKQEKVLDKMIEGMQQVIKDKERHKLPSWDGLRGERSASGDVLKNFVLRFHVQLASWAAYNIAKYNPLKGALFVFSKVSFNDLVDVDPNIGVFTESKLDRSFAIAWGCRPVAGVTKQSAFSYLNLAEKFMNNATSLHHLMENGCNRDSFPIVICCDPSGQNLPALFNQHLRFPKNVDPVCYINETPSQTMVTVTRFWDFDAMLEFTKGDETADYEAKFMNIDRDESNPNWD